MSLKHLVVVVGPTAVGKTAISIEIAKTLKCPVLSADSRQFFKEMTIGTAKPSTEEMQGVPHYFIDSHSINTEFNVGAFESEAMALLGRLFEENEVVVMVGGSGLYIDAVCKGLDELPRANKEVRTHIENIKAKDGLEGMQALLRQLDPEYYLQVDLNNPQRLSRALEVCLTTGKPFSELRKGKTQKRDFACVKIGLNTDREELYERINERVNEMMQNGLLEEAKLLQPYRTLNALQTVGYKELFDFLEGKTDLQTAVHLIKQNTRRFAKRQLTWFRKDEEIKWFNPRQKNEIVCFVKEQCLK